MNKQKPKILLINPPYIVHKDRPKRASTPLGIAYLGAYLRENDYDVKLLDSYIEGIDTKTPIKDEKVMVGLTMEEIKKIIEEYKPDMVGISCIFHNTLTPTKKLAQTAKKANVPLVAVGGTHASSIPELVMKEKSVDFVILGEGERSFLNLLNAIFKNKGDYKKLDGLAFREQDEIIINPKTNFLSKEELDNLPFPARDLLPMEKYMQNMMHGSISPGARTLEIMTSRGCIAKCAFCAATRFLNPRFTGRNPENVIKELKLLKKQYDIQGIQFEDDNLTADKERIIKIMRMMVEENLNLKWTTPNGIALYALDEEVISWMKKSGCVSVVCTIESGNQRVLYEIMKKPLNLEKAREVTLLFNKYNIDTIGTFMVGLPGETLEEVKQTFKFAYKLGFLETQFGYYTPLPGTPLWDLCKKEGYVDDNFLERIQENDFRIPKISTSEWTLQELRRVVQKEELLYYLKTFLRHPLKFIKRYRQNYKLPIILKLFRFWVIRSFQKV